MGAYTKHGYQYCDVAWTLATQPALERSKLPACGPVQTEARLLVVLMLQQAFKIQMIAGLSDLGHSSNPGCLFIH